MGVRAVRHRRSLRGRAVARPHRSRRDHGALFPTPLEAAGQGDVLPAADEPVPRGRDSIQRRTASRSTRSHRDARTVRHGAITAESPQRAGDPSRPARAPPEGATALRVVPFADAAGLRHRPTRHHLRLLRLLRPRRQEDPLHPQSRPRTSGGTPRRGLLCLDHHQRSRLPRTEPG